MRTRASGPQLRLPAQLPSPSPSGWNQDSHRELCGDGGAPRPGVSQNQGTPVAHPPPQNLIPLSPSLQRGNRGPRAVEVDVLPLAVAAVPDAGLLRLAGARPALGIDVLGEADVGDAGSVLADDVDVGVQDGCVDRLVVLGEHCGGRAAVSGAGRVTGRDGGRAGGWMAKQARGWAGGEGFREAGRMGRQGGWTGRRDRQVAQAGWIERLGGIKAGGTGRMGRQGGIEAGRSGWTGRQDGQRGRMGRDGAGRRDKQAEMGGWTCRQDRQAEENQMGNRQDKQGSRQWPGRVWAAEQEGWAGQMDRRTKQGQRGDRQGLLGKGWEVWLDRGTGRKMGGDGQDRLAGRWGGQTGTGKANRQGTDRMGRQAGDRQEGQAGQAGGSRQGSAKEAGRMDGDGLGRQGTGRGQAGRRQRRALTVLEVEAVEVHALHQVAQGLGLKGGEPRVADLPARQWVSSSLARPHPAPPCPTLGTPLTHRLQSPRC